MKHLIEDLIGVLCLFGGAYVFLFLGWAFLG